MKVDSLSRILDGVTGVRKDGGAHLFPEDVDVSIFIGLPAEVLSLPRVARLTSTPDMVTIETAKGERYYFAPEVIVGVKVGGAENKAHPRGPGFR